MRADCLDQDNSNLVIGMVGCQESSEPDRKTKQTECVSATHDIIGDADLRLGRVLERQKVTLTNDQIGIYNVNNWSDCDKGLDDEEGHPS